MSRFEHYKWYFLHLLVFWLSGQPAQALSGKYPIQNFTPAEYRAGIQNIDFAQNRDMTLFVANNLGVLSFNGNEWRTHDFRTGKKKRSLAFDERTNRLYVGSQGEFGYFEEEWQYVSLIDQIPPDSRDFDEVWDVLLVNDKVYFCTFQGIYAYDGQTISIIEHESRLERSFLANGKIFTQNQRGRLFEVEGSNLVHNYPQAKTGEVIAGVIAEEEGYLLIYNSGQIEWTTPLGVTRKYDDLIRVLEGTYVNHVLQLSDTRLAISTQTSGLFLYNPQERSLEKITTREGLATNACLRSFQDHFGNLWVGMQNGIALIHLNSPMRLLNREINIQGSGYEAFETSDGIYYTTSNGIYFLAPNVTQCVFLPGTEGPAYGMQEIAGKLYAGHHTGLFLLEKGQARRIANTDGLWKVKQLRSRPEFAIGGAYSGLYLFKMDTNRQLQAVRKISGFSASSRFFEEDRLGRIWVGQYYQGLYRLTLSENLTEVTVKNISEHSDLPIDEQIVLSRIADELYLATNSGLYQLDATSGAVEKADLFFDQIGEQPVYLLAQDQKNNVHIIAENLMAFFRQISASNYLFVPSSLYQLRYHLNNDLLHASTNISPGILFSANEGFIHYDPALEVPLKIEKPLLVSRVFSVTEGRAVYARPPFEAKPENIAPLEISSKAKVLKINVESFQFNDLGSQQFRYFLKGLDKHFGEWTTAATKEYTNLREGAYEFTVQTRNYRGEVVTGQTLYLTVKPPFLRSPLAKFLYALMGLLALFLTFRLQRRQYKRKAKKSEEARQLERASEQQKLIEVQQQKEQELQRLKEEKMQSELQHVNNLLAASTMNLVVKNEFIEAIKDELEEVKQKGKHIETKRALEKIVKGIDTTLKLQEDWEQFEYHFDAVHGDFLTRLRNDYPDLSPNEQKLCVFLRLNLNTKEIANLLGISIRGVEVGRYRLRKKLDLDRGQNLSKFILEY
jgi:ligand-binding sensor domain-containing protein/DNA-binding CsgD family transcriptional regulator